MMYRQCARSLIDAPLYATDQRLFQIYAARLIHDIAKRKSQCNIEMNDREQVLEARL